MLQLALQDISVSKVKALVSLLLNALLDILVMRRPMNVFRKPHVMRRNGSLTKRRNFVLLHVIPFWNSHTTTTAFV